MVKGVNRRVVVVKSPDPKVFEEAIFVVREDYLSSGAVTSEDILREAQKIANIYAKSELSRSQRLMAKLPAPAFAAAGAAAAGIAWLTMRLVGV